MTAATTITNRSGVRFSASADLSVPDVTKAVPVQDALTIQLTGDAAAITALVKRSTRDPDKPAGANWAVIDTLTGDLTAGIEPQTYVEDGASWWCVEVTVLTGGSVHIDIAGKSWP